MQARLILELNDSELVQQVQKRLETQALFSDSELNIAREYINSKLPLIRDLAQNRLIVT